jgi:hypothetical protein
MWPMAPLAALARLALMPRWAWHIAAGAALVGAGVWWHHRALERAHWAGFRAGQAEVQWRWDRADQRAAAAASYAQAEAERETRRREAALRKELDDALAARDRAAADARHADAAAVGLRHAARAAAAACGGASAGHPAAAGGGQAAVSAGDLLADVLGRMDEAGRELARVADERGTAGGLCERAWNGLAGGREVSP